MEHLRKIIKEYEEKHNKRLVLKDIAIRLYPESNIFTAQSKFSNLLHSRNKTITVETLKTLCEILECSASHLLKF